MKKGYIYIITNPAWSEYVKIGRSYDTKNRLKSYQTSSPLRDYEIYYEVYTENLTHIENIFSEKFGKLNGEWYKIDKDEAKSIIEKNVIHNVNKNQPIINTEIFNTIDYKNEIIYDCFEFDPCSINFLEFYCIDRTANKRILSAKEACFLKLLTTNQGKILSKEMILNSVYKIYTNINLRSIDNYMVKFRKLFEIDSKNPIHFLTIRGIGYKFS